MSSLCMLGDKEDSVTEGVFVCIVKYTDLLLKGWRRRVIITIIDIITIISL